MKKIQVGPPKLNDIPICSLNKFALTRGQGFDHHSLQKGWRSFFTLSRTGSSLPTLSMGKAVYISISPYTVKDGIRTHNALKTILRVTLISLPMFHL